MAVTSGPARPSGRRQPYPAAAVYQRRPWPTPWRQPRPTKPLVIVHVAVVLSVAAVVVSTLIMTGDLSFLIPEYVEKDVMCNLFEEDIYECDRAWRQNLAFLLVIIRQNNGSQRHLVFSHLQPAKKITAKNCNKFFISVLSLSVRLLLFLLLVIAGDVERNPGPLSKEDIGKVSKDLLTEEDFVDIYAEVVTLAVNWRHVAYRLGLLPTDVALIETKHANQPDVCLQSSLTSWLQLRYNVKKHKLPSWHSLVCAVEHPVGGNNPALAERIAKKHSCAAKSVDQDAEQSSKDNSKSVLSPSSPCLPSHCLVEGLRLSAKFARAMTTIQENLDKSTRVEELKEFLANLCHPLIPEKNYIEKHVYECETTTKNVIASLIPKFINYLHLILLEEIIDTFKDEEARRALGEYKKASRKSRLNALSPTSSDEEIDDFPEQKRVKVTVDLDEHEVVLEDVDKITKAMEQATGIARSVQVLTSTHASTSVLLIFVVPNAVTEIFKHLSPKDLTILADAGITKLKVENFALVCISKYATKIPSLYRCGAETVGFIMGEEKTETDAERKTDTLRLAKVLKNHYTGTQDPQRKSVSKKKRVDTRFIKLKKGASKALKEFDYTTKLQTVEEFRDEVQTVSPKQVVNLISLAPPGTLISITGPRGIGKSVFIGRMCHYWALGYGLRRSEVLFWLDMATAPDQPFHNYRNLLSAALNYSGKIHDDAVSVVVLDNYSSQWNEVLVQMLQMKITVVVTSYEPVRTMTESVSRHHIHLVGLTDDQISQLVLHYYRAEEQSKCEPFLQYLSTVPNFSRLKRVPVYLFGLLSVFDAIPTPNRMPDTLTAFLSCLSLLVVHEHPNCALERSFLQTIDNLPSTSKKSLQKICQFIFEKRIMSHDLFVSVNRSFLRPEPSALCLQSGKSLQLTAYPLLDDYLASVHLCSLEQQVTEVVQYITAHTNMYYFCLNLMPHIKSVTTRQPETRNALTHVCYSYEDSNSTAYTFQSIELSNCAVTEATMKYLTHIARIVEFVDCDVSSAATAILCSSIGDGGSVHAYTMPGDTTSVEYVSSSSRQIRHCVTSTLHPLATDVKTYRKLTLFSRFNEMSWWSFMTKMVTLKDCGMTKVNLDGVGLRVEGAVSLVKSIKLSMRSLKILNIHYNDIGDEGAVAMAEVLKSHQCLETLDLRRNGIGDKGAIAIAAGLRCNSSLQSLDLEGNTIGSKGGVAIGEMLSLNQTLISLSLNGNSIGDKGAVSVAAGVRSNHSLQSLDLVGNRIGAKGGVALGDALAVNKTLLTISLQYNDMGDAGAIAITTGLQLNRSLQNIEIWGNNISSRIKRQQVINYLR